MFCVLSGNVFSLLVFYFLLLLFIGSLYGLVARVPGSRSKGSGSISGATRLFEKRWGLVSTIEELLGRWSRDSGLESLKYGRRDPSRWLRGTL
jgi:hypothetical protein